MKQFTFHCELPSSQRVVEITVWPILAKFHPFGKN